MVLVEVRANPYPRLGTIQRGAQEGMDMDLLSDGSECKNGRVTIVEPGVGYGEKSMASLEEQTHRIANTSFTADGCAQATHGFIGDEDG